MVKKRRSDDSQKIARTQKIMLNEGNGDRRTNIDTHRMCATHSHVRVHKMHTPLMLYIYTCDDNYANIMCDLYS